MSASYLFSQDQSRVDSAKFLGSGVQLQYASLGAGAIPATSTLSAYQSHSQGMYALNAVVDIAGAGGLVDNLKYQLWINNSSNLLENTVASTIMNTVGNALTYNHPVFINTGGLPTASTVVAYQSLGTGLNPGASGNVNFSLTRLC